MLVVFLCWRSSRRNDLPSLGPDKGLVIDNTMVAPITPRHDLLSIVGHTSCLPHRCYSVSRQLINFHALSIYNIYIVPVVCPSLSFVELPSYVCFPLLPSCFVLQSTFCFYCNFCRPWSSRLKGSYTSNAFRAVWYSSNMILLCVEVQTNRGHTPENSPANRSVRHIVASDRRTESDKITRVSVGPPTEVGLVICV